MKQSKRLQLNNVSTSDRADAENPELEQHFRGKCRRKTVDRQLLDEENVGHPARAGPHQAKGSADDEHRRQRDVATNC